MKINISNVEFIMAMKGLKSYQVAEKAGMSRQAFSTVKQRGTCTPRTVAKIAKGLGVEVEKIIVKEE